MRARYLGISLLAAAAFARPALATDERRLVPKVETTGGTEAETEVDIDVETEAGTEGDSQEEPPSKGGLFDTLHGAVEFGLRGSATWIDRFFSDERYEAELNKTRLRLRYDTFAQEGDGVESKVRPSVRLVLPGTGKRLSLIAKDPSDREEDLDDAAGSSSVADTDEAVEDDFSLALQYLFESTRKRSLRGQVGIRIGNASAAGFVGARYRELIGFGTWDSRFVQRVRWYTDTGFQADTTIDFERNLFDDLLFRATAEGTWFEEETGYFYNLGLRLFQPLDESGALEYQWINDFRTSPSNRLEETKLRVRYRRKVWWDWLVLEIAPEAAFPRERDFDFTPGILLRLEAIFGG